MEVRFLQLQNALLPMLTTPSGIIKEVRLLPEKALSPIHITLLGITVALQPSIKVLVLVSIMALQPSRESYIALPSSTTMEIRLLQPKKALPSILVTLWGIMMEVRLLQLLKADFPIFVTLSGIVMEVRLLQDENANSPILVILWGIVIETRLVQFVNVL